MLPAGRATPAIALPGWPFPLEGAAPPLPASGWTESAMRRTHPSPDVAARLRCRIVADQIRTVTDRFSSSAYCRIWHVMHYCCLG